MRNAQNSILTGLLGAGKTWFARAFGQQASPQGFSESYVRVVRVFEGQRSAHGDGGFTRRLAQRARIEVLIIGNLGFPNFNRAARNDRLEVLDNRAGPRSTVITSQLPLGHWNAWSQDPTLADATLDRFVHQTHKRRVKGDPMRKETKSESGGA